MYFLFFILLLPHVYQFRDHLTYIVLIFWYIYIYIYMLMYVYSPISSCVVSFLSLCTCFLLFVCNLLFLFHTKMPWWVLFKVFQKYRLSKSFLPWTLFLQSFSRVCVRIDFFFFLRKRIDLLYSTSEYELSDLWLFSYVHFFVVVLSQIAKEGDC